jgi:hypothetical protein
MIYLLRIRNRINGNNGQKPHPSPPSPKKTNRNHKFLLLEKSGKREQQRKSARSIFEKA